MKKKDLLELGLTEEQADKVTALSAEELKGYVPMARFNEINEARKHAEESVSERDKQIEGLKSSAGDAEKLKKQIDDLQAANKQKDSDHAAEIRQLKIDAAVDTALTAAKAKNLKAARALLSLDKAELSEDGTVKGLAEQIQTLKTADDSKFLFEAAGKMKGAKAGEDGREEGDKKPDLKAMSYDELCKYLEENPDATLED